MIRIAMCDDETMFLQTYQKKVSELFQEHNVDCKIDTYTDTVRFLEHCEKTSYDLIFLDIDMPGLDGIETAKALRKSDKKVKIIYITNYGGFAGYAFGVHAFGYLLKPVKEPDIKRQLKEAREYMEKESERPMAELFTKAGRIRIAVEDIYYFEYTSRMLQVHTREGVYEQQEKISECLEKMRPYGFAMPHKSFVVNLDQVRGIRGYDITLMDGSIVPLSQKKGKSFREELGLFLAGRM